MNQGRLQAIDYLREKNAFFLNSLAGGAYGLRVSSAVAWPVTRRQEKLQQERKSYPH
jgi:hypothetical protein